MNYIHFASQKQCEYVQCARGLRQEHETSLSWICHINCMKKLMKPFYYIFVIILVIYHIKIFVTLYVNLKLESEYLK